MDQQPGSLRLLRHVLRTIGWVLCVVASLLAFPSVIPWMAAGWLLIAAGLTACKAKAWLPLALCVAILLVKGIPMFVSTIVLLAIWTIVSIGLSPLIAWPEQYRRHVALVGLMACAAAWMGFAVQWYFATQSSHRPVLQPERPIVCVGDSLTSGMGPEGGYPEALQELVSPSVVNLGREGITTADAIAMIPQIQAMGPQVIVIELGVHDFLKGKPRSEAKANLEKLIAAARSVGAEPVLVEVPRGFIFDGYRGLERELAWQYDLQLVSDTAIRQAVIWSPHAPPSMWTGGPYLSDDGLHPNRQGNERLAEQVAKALRALFGSNVASAASSD